MRNISRRRFIGDSLLASAAFLYDPVHSNGSIPNSPQPTVGRRPNIVLIMADDMGFSDLGCYGSEISTPHLDGLAKEGTRFTQFYNCARCCPTRASLLTGLYPHQAGIGDMTDDRGLPGYRGDLNHSCVTIAEALQGAGYNTLMCGKWHVTPTEDRSKHNWPLQRGFKKFFGTIAGAGSYYDPVTLTRDNTPIRATDPEFYYTDAISQNAVQYIAEQGRQDTPFFLYVAFTSPHWPLHAFPEDIAKYQNTYTKGWDALRRERHQRMIEMGIVDKAWPLSVRDPRVPPWEFAPDRDWEARRMAVFAAQIERMDRGIGSILAKLREMGIEEDTLVLFLADNGGCAEVIRSSWHGSLFMPHATRDGRLVHSGNDPSIMPGADDTYASYGIAWANASNTPFRLYKHWAHEGGISTPLIARWPSAVKGQGALHQRIGHVTDIMPTCLEAAGAEYPKTYNGQEITPFEGKSLLPALRGTEARRDGIVYWEHEGNTAVRDGRGKMVARHPDYWELYDMEADRTEQVNLLEKHPEKVRELTAKYETWAKRCNVAPWPVPELPSQR